MKKFVITLDRTPDRWAEFRARNKELTVARFNAFDGLCLDRTKLAQEGLTEVGLRYSQGALGCASSHVELWRRCAAGGEAFMVLEDDAVVHQDVEVLFYRLREPLPVGWDYLALGFNMDCPVQFELLPGVTPCRGTFLADGVAANLKKFKSLELRPIAYRLQLCFGTPGYVITPTGAQKLLKLLLPLKNFTMTASCGLDLKNAGIDVALNSVFAKINAYVSIPPLVITPNNKAASTVQGS